MVYLAKYGNVCYLSSEDRKERQGFEFVKSELEMKCGDYLKERPLDIRIGSDHTPSRHSLYQSWTRHVARGVFVSVVSRVKTGLSRIGTTLPLRPSSPCRYLYLLACTTSALCLPPQEALHHAGYPDFQGGSSVTHHTGRLTRST
jgi:hypothetical protein